LLRLEEFDNITWERTF